MGTDTASDDPNQQDLVNWSTALDVVGGDRQLLAEVIDAFLQEAPRQMEAIRQAVVAGDAPLLRRAAHTLKGSLRYFGCQAAFVRALNLELAGQQGQTQQLDQAVNELAGLLARVLELLAEQVRRGGTP